MKTPTKPEDVKARWGRQLQEKRQSLNETQAQLAHRLERDTTTISRIERGKGDLEAFLYVANALGVDLLGESS